MPTRRELLRLLSLAPLAVAAPSLVAGCSEEDAGPGGPDADGLRLVSSDVARAPGVEAAVPEAVASLHAVGAGLWRRLGEQSGSPSGNLALSPYSVGVALAMTANGARGETREQMRQVLSAPELAALNGGLNALTRHVESLAGTFERGGEPVEVALDSANGLFGQRGTDWERDFLDVLARHYGAGVHVVDWAAATDQARRLVNAWTAERTRDRIDQILPADAVDGLTRLVLVNALYLKAPWAHPFEEHATRDRPFTLPDGRVVQVPTMHTSLDAASYAAGDGWQAVAIPYVGDGLAMTVVLPEPGRLDELDDLVGRGGLPGLLAAPRPEPVDLTLPRWTFRTTAPLKDALSALGMPRAFDPTAADFSGMSEELADLHLDAVLHEVFIAVDEEGTEAAAATAVVAGVTSAPAAPRVVVVDRPFLFVVHDIEEGTPLFLGRVADPRG